MTGIYKSAEGARAVQARYAELRQAWPVPHQVRRIPTSQGETAIIVCGPEDGPPVLLLHGTAFNAISWMGDVAAWATRFRIHAVDIIGEPGMSAPSRPDLNSDAHARWLVDVLDGLGVARAALVGLSFGGWLGFDLATRYPDRVGALVALCPAGIGRHKNVLLWALPLLLAGPWGRRRLNRLIMGPRPAGDADDADMAAATDFMALIHRHVRMRTARMPIFGDADLARLTMPVMAILGGRDVMVDSPGIRQRLTALVPHARIVWLPGAGHALIGQTQTIGDFLTEAWEKQPWRM